MEKAILSNEEREAILQNGLEDVHFFCTTFLPHWFTGEKTGETEIAPVHAGILAIQTRTCDWLLDHYNEEELAWIERNFEYSVEGERFQIFNLTGPDAPKMQVDPYTLMMIPRGYAKTTCTNAANLWDILYQNHSVIAYISETATHAQMQLGNIKHELESNTMIHLVFGDLKPAQRDGKWAEDFFETETGIAMLARGSGAQVRGLLHHGKRPSKINLDDLEDKDSVRSDAQRQKTREWYYGDVEPALDELSGNTTIICAGTLLHHDALLEYLRNDPRWTVLKFGALDKDGEPIWHRKGKEFLDTKKAAFTKAGMLHIYYLEFFNEVRTPDMQSFPSKYTIIPRRIGDVDLRGVFIDPAISEDSQADYCSLIVGGLSSRGFYHVFETRIERGMLPRQQVDEFFRMSIEYECHSKLHGIETISYQASLAHLMREEMFRKKHFFEIYKLSYHSQQKDKRIQGILQPRYNEGFITHQKHFSQLEMQLMDFPNGKKDGPDCLAMLIAMFGQFNGLVGSEGGEDDEAPPLEDVFGGDWREH